MEPSTLSLILLRVLSVYLAAKGLLYIPEIATVWSSVSAFGGEWPGPGIYSLMAVTPLVLALALWVLSPWLAKMIVPRDKPGESTGAVPVDRIQSAILATVGVLLILTTVPGLVAVAIEMLGEGQAIDTAHVAHIASQLTRMLVGAVLVVGSHYFVRLMHRFRELGLEHKDL